MSQAPNFDPAEAEALVSFSAVFQGPTPPLELPTPPSAWKNTFTSGSIGAFDNAWQLWSNEAANQYAVVIRGTIDATGSVMEDLMSIMIPATGSFPAGSVRLDYKLAEDPKASVHLGFFLGLSVLLFDAKGGIINRLLTLPNGANIFVSGHSQGAAIATLCRSFLEYSPLLMSKGFSYKSYVFAQPKPGNDHYGWDFEHVAGDSATAYRVTNSEDWVPQVPLTLQTVDHLNVPNPLSVMTKHLEFRILVDGIELFKKALAEVHRKRHLPQVAALESILRGQTLVPVSAGDAAELPIVPTLNFMNCGSAVSLRGTPGLNPADPGDSFWQHHAAMYHKLLKAQFPAATA